MVLGGYVGTWPIKNEVAERGVLKAGEEYDQGGARRGKKRGRKKMSGRGR